MKLDEYEIWLKGLVFMALHSNDQQFSIIYNQQDIKN